MQLFLRILAVLLVLMTGGVFQTLAFASDTHADCAEEEEGADDCTDCAPSCAMCQCCPLRAAPAPVPVIEQPEPGPALPPVPSRVDEPVLSGPGADIFQPPRA
ncbi:hypothetical protein HPC49_03830 [Pyxidicoccus fallax]|uniref:Secreted protein n=1 Tax=Pyxidicoccus fallax TaxID=394095 RepID=A0A848L7S8_9BACT|nr:hypothetical protein [Pyxidicoccus fallax]NMO14616.1 hypothetical protein [Pyxidicoccus fallax]NPC77380.1 hypothetical protein [Pyxidicoccus fallax]